MRFLTVVLLAIIAIELYELNMVVYNRLPDARIFHSNVVPKKS